MRGYNSLNATINGFGLLTHGFVWAPNTVIVTFSGLGLETFGLLWNLADIYEPCALAYPAVWADCF